MDRFESEANLASEYASKLSTTRTIPDAVAVSRDWATRYFQMLAEDGQHLADDTRKFMETGARFFSNGFERPAAAASSGRFRPTDPNARKVCLCRLVCADVSISVKTGRAFLIRRGTLLRIVLALALEPRHYFPVRGVSVGPVHDVDGPCPR
jgi:hypothetical protein